ncbi:hypothetical protein [Polaromonas sp.]|jgi:hypothetical protein|uniref:hypothetical protein n=1 Tax=Polaromonas sp. TaxID=1869339 RepID=UPI001A1A56BF|nr:hypothetical protein [Burkholderiales bacterium]
MATSSILGGSKLPEEISGKDMHALGPSDNSDSGSDAMGAYGDEELSSDSDSAGTGERAEVGMGREHPDADILPDRIEQAPGVDAETDLDDDLDDLSDVEDLADDSENLDADEDDEAADASGKA